MGDRRTIAIIGSGLVVVAAVLFVVFAAIEPIPDFPPIEAGQETGFVAYVADQEGSEVLVLDLSDLGSVAIDTSRGVELLGFDEEGYLVMMRFGPQEQVHRYDPATGERVGEPVAMDEDLWNQFPEEPVWVDQDGNEVVLEMDGGASASFEAPESYRVGSATSMDEDRIVFTDELGRLALVHVGQDQQPILLDDDVSPWWRVAARP